LNKNKSLNLLLPKKTITYLFLSAFLFQALIFNVCLYTFTLLVKFEEKTGNKQWIEFSETEYSKLKLNETEFSYNNNLYDIIQSKTENGTIKLLCKIDTKEKDLLEKLIESFKNSKTKKNISFSFLGEINNSNEFLSNFNSNSALKHTFFITSITEKSLGKTTPPPKI